MGDEKELKQDDANRVANHALENLAWIEANMNERAAKMRKEE